ncbi:MAG: hypothetical protein ACXV2F_02175, partial [Halobacteriota archaeon]
MHISQRFQRNANKRFQLKASLVVAAPAIALLMTCGGSASAATRDPLKQPFASTSIWNMPIGSGAVFTPANISPNPAN